MTRAEALEERRLLLVRLKQHKRDAALYYTLNAFLGACKIGDRMKKARR